MPATMSVTVTRHYATVDGRFGRRQVHYRRAGRGPAVLLLHQSPQSSRELEPVMAEWGRWCTAIAPDTPGYGLSDPLGVAEASLDDFAAASVEFLDAIGVGRAAVYGFHTGGMIGVALGHRHPDRITAVACNGLLVLDEAERGPILADYLPAIEPRWDGGHLAWAWARNREQAIFFPWHWPALARRMDFPMPSASHQQQALLELLRAADTYHIAYRGAFLFDGPAALRAMAVPTVVTASPLDPLSAHLGRIGPVAGTVTVEASPAPDAALARLAAHVQAHPGTEPPPAPPAMARPAGDTALRRAVIPTPVAAIHLRWNRRPAAGECAVLLLHAPGASGATWGGSLLQLAATRPVVALDLPGHGESGPLVHPSLGRVASAIAATLATLDALGLERVRVLADGWGATFALALAAAAPGRFASLHLVGRPDPDAAGSAAWRASLEPETVDWHGGHLLRYWHTVRDGRLYRPWFQRDRAAIRWEEPDLDGRRLQRDVLELMKSAGHWQELLNELLDLAAADPVAPVRARGIPLHEAAAGSDPATLLAGPAA
jgi:pimeloyl-ACP methyl ester carboxylesterase